MHGFFILNQYKEEVKMKKILKIGISVIAVTLMFSFLGCEKNSSEIKEASKIED